jgi:hypothetical protein
LVQIRFGGACSKYFGEVLEMLGTKVISRSKQTAVALALTLGLTSVGVCHTTVSEDSQLSYSGSQEEITVYGEKSLVRLRHAFYRAQENLFSVFNDLNSNDEFDVVCDYSVRPNRRQHHLCRPKFAIKAEAMATQDAMRGAAYHGVGLSEYSPHVARIKKKNELLWAEMRALLVEQPALQRALAGLVKAKDRYELELKNR